MLLEESIKKYVGLQIKQAKFELVELVAKERSKIIIGSVLGLLFLLLLIFGSLYTSFLLNSILESDHLGFGIVFLFWVLSFTAVLLFKESIKGMLFRNYTNNNIPS